MSNSTLQIIYQDGKACEVLWDQKYDMIVPLLGGLEVAKGHLMRCLYQGPQEIRSQESMLQQSGKRRVKKSEALDHYLKVGQQLQKRIKAIQASDDEAVFYIDPILSHIFDECHTE